MKSINLQIQWNPDMSIFASESFLKAVGNEYGWIGGIDENNKLRCILPYTVIHTMGIRMVRFRVETLCLDAEFAVEQERLFLHSAMRYLQDRGADVVIPATTNAIFRTYPPGGDAAPYGTFEIDLSEPEDVIWRNIHRITRQNIGTAQRNGVRVSNGQQHLDIVYRLIRDTFGRSRLPFMSYAALDRYVKSLGENGRILVAEHEGVVHSCVIYAFSRYCAYAVYGGNLSPQQPGANKLLHWEAMREFREEGVCRYDFVGTRIDPARGSKQEALDSFKRRFGGTLRQGYIWKYCLRPVRSLAYSWGVRLLRGGDIVDRERHKLKAVGNRT